MSCVWSSEGGFQVVYPFGICGPVNSELSMSNRIRLSKFRFTLLYFTCHAAPIDFMCMPTPLVAPGSRCADMPRRPCTPYTCVRNRPCQR